jgi:hypothetical protein
VNLLKINEKTIIDLTNVDLSTGHTVLSPEDFSINVVFDDLFSLKMTG